MGWVPTRQTDDCMRGTRIWRQVWPEPKRREGKRLSEESREMGGLNRQVKEYLSIYRKPWKAMARIKQGGRDVIRFVFQKFTS